MDLARLRAILWKELLDLARDRKTLAVTALLPLVSMPLLALTMAFFSSQQVSRVAVLALDDTEGCIGGTCINSTVVASIIERSISGSDVVVEVNPSGNLTDYDVVVVIPEGFSENLTSLDRVAYVRLVKNVGSSKAELVYQSILSTLRGLGRELAKLKIEELANISGVEVLPDSILDPVREVRVLVTPTGQPAEERDEFRIWTARFLAFALAFIVMPPTVFITDSIAGERDRKTLETLLTTPVSRSTLLTGKLLASNVLGIIAAAADVAGVIIFFKMLGAYMLVDPSLLLVHAVDVALTIFVTSTIIIPIVSRADTARSAQSMSTLITTIAIVIFFTMLSVDIPRLPAHIRYPLYLVPYTHSALLIYNYVLGYNVQVLLHAAVLVALSAVLLVVSYRLFNSEKIITKT